MAKNYGNFNIFSIEKFYNILYNDIEYVLYKGA